MLIVVALAIVLMASAGSLFLFGAGRVWSVLGPPLLWLSLSVLFFPLYYTFSGADASAAEVLPGTAVAAAGWAVPAIGLRIYVT